MQGGHDVIIILSIKNEMAAVKKSRFYAFSVLFLFLIFNFFFFFFYLYIPSFRVWGFTNDCKFCISVNKY